MWLLGRDGRGYKGWDTRGPVPKVSWHIILATWHKRMVYEVATAPGKWANLWQKRRVGTPALINGSDDTTPCPPGKDAESKLSCKWRRIPGSLMSNFETSLGQQSPDPPGDLSVCDLWNVWFLYSWMWMVTTPEDFMRRGCCDLGTGWWRRGCPAPASWQFPGSWFPCPWKVGCGSTATAAEGQRPLRPCASLIWPPQNATCVAKASSTSSLWEETKQNSLGSSYFYCCWHV